NSFKGHFTIGPIKTQHVRRYSQVKKTLFKIAFLLSFASVVAAAQNTSFVKSGDDDDETAKNFVAPKVFQAAGPTVASIQSPVDEYRAAVGQPNNGNLTAQASGRREINWDGGGANTTTAPVTPFNVFLNTRGGQFTTPGLGLSQATPAGLAVLFDNPSYANIFRTFSPLRLFTPVGSNITDAQFFLAG